MEGLAEMKGKQDILEMRKYIVKLKILVVNFFWEIVENFDVNFFD